MVYRRQCRKALGRGAGGEWHYCPGELRVFYTRAAVPDPDRPFWKRQRFHWVRQGLYCPRCHAVYPDEEQGKQ
jgi:hypothetical protein